MNSPARASRGADCSTHQLARYIADALTRWRQSLPASRHVKHACAPYTRAQDDPSLAALQQRLEAVTQQYRDAQHCDEATKKADDADREMGVVSKRIFDARPITLHNLKQRAVLAKYWHQHNTMARNGTVPEDCGAGNMRSSPS